MFGNSKEEKKEAAAKKEASKMTPPKVSVSTRRALITGEDEGSKAEEGTEMVTVTCPKPFNLVISHGVAFKYAAGIQEMPLEHAEHWYAVANGVTVYDPKAAAKKRAADAQAEVDAAKKEEAHLTWKADEGLRNEFKDDFEAYFASLQSKE